MSENDKSVCGKPAVNLVGWGFYDPIPMCIDHFAWAARVMGALQATLIVRVAEPGSTCTQFVNSEDPEGSLENRGTDGIS